MERRESLQLRDPKPQPRYVQIECVPSLRRFHSPFFPDAPSTGGARKKRSVRVRVPPVLCFHRLVMRGSHLREAFGARSFQWHWMDGLTFCWSMRFFGSSTARRFSHCSRNAPERRSAEGTNKRAAAYPGDRPSFPPSPVLGWSFLGAADGPIGCALIFLQDVFDGAHFLAVRHSLARVISSWRHQHTSSDQMRDPTRCAIRQDADDSKSAPQ